LTFVKTGLFSHNSASRHGRKSDKGSKDADFSLVSKKNLSQNHGSSGWRPVPGKFAKNTKTCPHSDVTFRKAKTQNEKTFLPCGLRLAESVEGLNSSLAQAGGKSWRCKLFKNCKKCGQPGTDRVKRWMFVDKIFDFSSR